MWSQSPCASRASAARMPGCARPAPRSTGSTCARGGGVTPAPERGHGAPGDAGPKLARGARAPRDNLPRHCPPGSYHARRHAVRGSRKRPDLRTCHRAYAVLRHAWRPPYVRQLPANARARTPSHPRLSLTSTLTRGRACPGARALPARKKAAAARVRKQRSVAHSVQRSAAGRPSAPGGSSADTTSGSSSAATWLDTVISACGARAPRSGPAPVLTGCTRARQRAGASARA